WGTNPGRDGPSRAGTGRHGRRVMAPAGLGIRGLSPAGAYAGGAFLVSVGAMTLPPPSPPHGNAAGPRGGPTVESRLRLLGLLGRLLLAPHPGRSRGRDNRALQVGRRRTLWPTAAEGERRDQGGQGGGELASGHVNLRG